MLIDLTYYSLFTHHCVQILIEFNNEFETLYYQRKAHRLDWVCHSVHAVSHLAPDTLVTGPGPYKNQWPLERMIGVYANLLQCAINSAQIKTARAIIHALSCNPWDQLPRGAMNIGSGYILLRAKNDLHDILPCESAAIEAATDSRPGAVTRWARVQLPNGQIARSRWKEALKPVEKLRTSCNVQVFSVFLVFLPQHLISHHGLQIRNTDDSISYAEVLYFFQLNVNSAERTYAMGCMYGAADGDLPRISHGAFYLVTKPADITCTVVRNVCQLLSVVAIAPHCIQRYTLSRKLRRYGDRSVEAWTYEERWFLVEKPGLKIAGVWEDNTDDDP